MKICIVSEGSYPIVLGGLSEWAHMLIKHLKDIEFDIFCIAPTSEDKWVPVYEKLPNVGKVIIKPLIRPHTLHQTSHTSKQLSVDLVKLLKQSSNGEPMDLRNLVKLHRSTDIKKGWLNSKSYFDFVAESSRRNYPEGSFSEYFWTFLGLNSILLDSMRFIRELPKADVYHSLSSGFAGFAGSLAKTVWNKPLVITEQGLYLVERRNELSRQNVSEWYRSQLIKFSESLVKTSYKYANLIVPPCLSHTKIEKEMGADPNKIMMINNGIELYRFTPSSRNGGKPVIGCFARVVPIKGITTLIQAAKIVCEKSPADFVVLGKIQDQEYYNQCQNLVKDLGLENRFRFMGHSNAAEWYHNVDIFTLSSISEGVPYALLEAMSSGLPSVCTAVGGIPEIISDGVGYVVPPARPDILAEKIGLLLDNKELRKKMGLQATAVANAKYDIDEMVEKFRALYTELAK